MTDHQHRTDGTPCECGPTRESYAEPAPASTYAERTERFETLAKFVGQFGIWGTEHTADPLDKDEDTDLVNLRGLAVESAFKAMRHIAEES